MKAEIVVGVACEEETDIAQLGQIERIAAALLDDMDRGSNGAEQIAPLKEFEKVRDEGGKVRCAIPIWYDDGKPATHLRVSPRADCRQSRPGERKDALRF